MKIQLAFIALIPLLSGCVQTAVSVATGIPANVVSNGSSSGPLLPIPVDGGKLPDTKQCRDYLNFAKAAGAPGTLGPLTKKYNACMDSAPNSKASKTFRCAPGTYYSWRGGVRVCAKS